MPRLVIDQLFPPETVARRRVELDAFWRGRDLGRPVFVPVPWRNDPTEDRGRPRDWFDTWVDHQRHVAAMPVDTLPCFPIDTAGTCTLASAFGGRLTLTPNGKHWIEPILQRAQDVFALRTPAATAGAVGVGLAQYRELLERVDGYVPPGMPDMQGPLQTAAMLWGEEAFILAMYDTPEAVHHLLGVVTDHFIAVARHLREHFRDTRVSSYPPAYLPSDLGQGIIEDFMHLLTPAQYEEFGLPCVNRIADAFGGVWVHCCGRFQHHWSAVKRIHNLRGLDTMYPFTQPEEVYAAFPDIVHSMGVDYAEVQRTFKDQGPDAWLAFLIAHTPRTVRWMFVTDADDPATVPRQLRLVERDWGGSGHCRRSL